MSDSKKKKGHVSKEKDTIEIEVKSKEDFKKNEESKTEMESEEDIKVIEEEKQLEDSDKIKELENEIAKSKDLLLRKVAEFENYKKRTENDQISLLKYAAESFILKILPIYDDFERSMSHINDSNNLESIKKGLSMVLEKFYKTLDDQGIKRIESKGKPFDVNLHEALMQQPAEGVPAFTVLEEVEPGYMYKDKVIRHSKVVVSQELIENSNIDKPESSQEDEEKKDKES